MKNSKQIILGSIILGIIVSLSSGPVCAQGANVLDKLPANLRNAIGKVNPFKTEKHAGQDIDAFTVNDVREMLTDILPYMKDPFIPKIPQDTKGDDDSGLPMPVDSVPIIGDDGQEILPPAYRIDGMVWNSQNPQAIVDGTILSVGDGIGGWTISAITKNGVEFRDQSGATFTLEP